MLRLALLVATLLAPLASAEHQRPGSLLVFPIVDARNAATTVLTVTNTNPDPAQTIHVEIVFVSNCVDYSLFFPLPPRDTLSLVAHLAFPVQGQGYGYAVAKNAAGRAISSNHIIGSVLVVDASTSREFQVAALTFASQFAEGALTDVDLDRRRDLNGIEYAHVPDLLLFPRFLGQSATYTSELVLMNLTGGSAYNAIVNVLIWNDNQEVFSAQTQVNCWARTSLLGVNGVFSNDFLLQATNHAPNETVLGREAGWFQLDGNFAASPGGNISNPAILGCLIEPALHSSASLPFGIGLQANGQLLPTNNL